MNREELQAIARIRLREAKALLSAGFPDGAYYLAGYAVECGLKACIAKGTRRYDFPDKKTVVGSYTHNLQDLVRVAQLEAHRRERAMLDSEFFDNWDRVQGWSEESRYQRHDRDSSAKFINAVDNTKHGVMSWLRRHW